MYDMYPWDKAAPADTGQDEAAGTLPPGPAIDAVQVALDRRDNGGDAAAQPGKPTASPARQ